MGVSFGDAFIFGTDVARGCGFWNSSAGLAKPTWSASFTDKPGLVPGMKYAVSDVENGALIPQFNGDLVKRLAKEIALWGGRRLWNQWEGASNDAATFNYGAASVLDSETVEFDESRLITGQALALEPGDYFYRFAVKAGTKNGTIALIDAGKTRPNPLVFVNLTSEWQTIEYRVTHVSGAAYPALSNRSLDGGDDVAGTVKVKDFTIYKARTGQTVMDPEHVPTGIVFLGDEQLDNGSFNDIADGTDIHGKHGWARFGTSVATVEGARLRIVANGANQGTYNNPPGVLAGDRFAVSFRASGDPGNLYVFSGDATKIAGPSVGSVVGFNTWHFLALVDNPRIYLRANSNTAGTTEFDDISFRKRISVGNGAEGVRWFDTDEYGNDLRVGLGPELVTDGSFTAADADWSLGDGWTIADGVASYDGVGTGDRSIYQALSFDTGSNHRFSFRVLSNSGSGANAVYIGGNTLVSNDHLAVGEHTYEGIATTPSRAYVYGASGELLVLDDWSVREVYPVRCTGVPRLRALINRMRSNTVVDGTWVTRGAGTLVGANSSQVGNYFQARGLSNNGNDAFTSNNGFAADSPVGMGFMLRAVSTSGLLRVGNPIHGDFGRWVIDLSKVSATRFELMIVGHPAITVVMPFVSVGDGCGAHFYSDNGVDSLDIDLALLTQDNGEHVALIETSGNAVTTQAEGPTLDVSQVPYDQDGSTWVVEYTPFLPANASPAGQVVLSLWQDSTHRVQLYNNGGTETGLGVYAVDGTTQAAFNGGPWVAGESVIAAMTAEPDNVRLITGGSLIATDSAATIPGSIVELRIGDGGFAGAIAAIYLFDNGAVNDAAGIALTTNPPAISLLPAPVAPVYAPSFSSPTAILAADENQTAAGSVSASGTGPIGYSIAGTDAAAFTINASTGALTFVAAPDYEVKTQYSVVVTATNAQGFADQTVTINVNDVADTAPVMTTAGTMGAVTGVGDTVAITQPIYTGSPSVLHEIIDLENNVLYTGVPINSWIIDAAAHGKSIRNRWTATNAAGSATPYISNSRGIPLGVEEWKSPNFDGANGLVLSSAWAISGGKLRGQVGVSGNINNGSSVTGRTMFYKGFVDSISVGSVIVAWDGTGGGTNQAIINTAGPFDFTKPVLNAGNYMWNNASDVIFDSYSARELLSAPADAAAP